MVSTWYDVATIVSRQADYGLKSKVEFASPVEISIRDIHSYYPNSYKKILVKELRTTGCNFTGNLEMSVIDVNNKHYGMHEVDTGIFQIYKCLIQKRNKTMKKMDKLRDFCISMVK